jgi:hypothetical protein
MRIEFSETEYNVTELIRIIESRGGCKCTYLKCPKCGRCQDNLNNLYILRIYELEEELAKYKQKEKIMV